jgi:hypothetical protein
MTPGNRESGGRGKGSVGGTTGFGAPLDSRSHLHAHFVAGKEEPLMEPKARVEPSPTGDKIRLGEQKAK